MTEALRVSRAVIDATLAHLRDAGAQQRECVVLWLARRDGASAHVAEVYRPEQSAAYDIFRIPPVSMNALLGHLGETGLFIGAQVHSHPQEAFHSAADDKWAIVRHIGAVSIVVPRFGGDTSSDTFFAESAVFVLSPRNRWVEVAPKDQLQIVVHA